MWGETGRNTDTGVLAQQLGKQKAEEWDSCVNQLQRRGADPRCQRGIMGFGKSSPFLAFSILVLCQAGSLQATPLRSALETLPDPGALSEKEGRLLLAALVKAYVQRKTNELEQEEEQEETEDSSLDSSRAKRCSNLSTCVLSAYWKDLNNYHRYSGMGFGPETPGKKRDIANSLEKDLSSHFGVPQDAN
ncbi:hypothetical protein AB1E18_011460 [Capra hircus]